MRRFRLGEEPAQSWQGSSIAERVALVWQLSQHMWELSAKPFPKYSRAEMPGQLIRLNKHTAGRTQDLADVEALEALLKQK